jgi:hypothetical protein
MILTALSTLFNFYIMRQSARRNRRHEAAVR